MKVVFLGTNGWYDTPAGNTICILIDIEKASIILDAGSGLYKADRYFSAGKPVHLFLSHLHLDHIIGLHLLNKFDIPQGLTIHCRKGDKESLNKIIAPPYSLPFSSLPYSVDIEEVDADLIELDGFSVQAALMMHSVPTIGFRLSLEGKTITYCPDTGYCDNAVRLAESADLLIAECAFRPGEESPHWPHLNPESAARLARDAGARQLVLVHFDASRYPDMDARRIAQVKAREIFPDTSFATDGQVLVIQPDSPANH
ncbi:MAG TPA: MBL fold metallo-hydrolase [Chlorobaculum sp.]|nr:MBL fold metallo-hydrolase [Chlorobaculum sp.]